MLPKIIDSNEFFATFRSLDVICQFCKVTVYTHEWFLISPEGSPIICSNMQGITQDDWDNYVSIYHTSNYIDGDQQTMSTTIRDDKEDRVERIVASVRNGVRFIKEEITDPNQGGVGGQVYARRHVVYYTRKVLLAEVDRDGNAAFIEES